jgi:hypothetical protein
LFTHIPLGLVSNRDLTVVHVLRPDLRDGEPGGPVEDGEEGGQQGEAGPGQAGHSHLQPAQQPGGREAANPLLVSHTQKKILYCLLSFWAVASPAIGEATVPKDPPHSRIFFWAGDAKNGFHAFYFLMTMTCFGKSELLNWMAEKEPLQS